MGTEFILNGVSCHRGGRRILHGISLDIADIETVSLLGPSGAGKTSLLRLLNGLDEYSEGTISFEGNELHDIPIRELRKTVGMVFQLPALFDSTVRENILFGPSLWGETADAEALLHQVGLPGDLIDRPSNELSVGQQKRVSLARTLANNPHVVLMDEPTANLDAASAARILELVKSLRDEIGVAVIMVSHLIQDAETLGGHTAILHEGRLIEFGPTDRVLNDPSSEITRQYLDGKLEPAQER